MGKAHVVGRGFASPAALGSVEISVADFSRYLRVGP